MAMMIKVNWKTPPTYHRPANVGAVVPFVLMFQYLHDKYEWGRYRFQDIMDEFEKFMKPPYPKYEKELEKLVDAGLDRQLYEDFMHWLPKTQDADDSYTVVLGHKSIRNKKERQELLEAADVTYILTFKILHEKYGFKKTKMNRMQEKLKFYNSCLCSKDVRIVEFMFCLAKECGQRYGALEEFVDKHGQNLAYF
jgi:hypothetical protein